MKILLLSTGGKIGGEETFTRNLALSLMKAGHVVEVATGGDVQREDLEKRGIKICPVDITSRKPLGLRRAAKELTKYVNDNNFDVVHAQAIGPAIMGVLAKKLFKCNTPWIWHNHGITDFAYNHIVKRLNSLDCIVANSDYVRESLKGHGVKPEVIKRIHNGIAYDDFYASKDEHTEAHKNLEKDYPDTIGKKKFIYVGRLSPEKGVEVFLRAFESLFKKHEDVSCVIVGDGIEKANLLKQIENYASKESIHFLGFRSDIKELVAGCDALILPSHIETFSLTSLQAFATGTPVIGSDVGGTPEQILDKFSGRLFPDNDHDGLCACMCEVVEAPERIEYYVHNAGELSKSYLNTSRMTDDIINVYKELIETK